MQLIDELKQLPDPTPEPSPVSSDEDEEEKADEVDPAVIHIRNETNEIN